MHGVARVRRDLVGGLVAFLLLAPAIASAQSAISGIVRDTSGAVMPGVTVEASSPVAHRKGPQRRDRRRGPIQHRRSPTRHL